jgi:hypothetical protein
VPNSGFAGQLLATQGEGGIQPAGLLPRAANLSFAAIQREQARLLRPRAAVFPRGNPREERGE